MTRDAQFSITENDLNQAMRLHTFSNYRQAGTLLKLFVLWLFGTGFMILIGYEDRPTWPERLWDVAPISLAFAAVMLGVIVGVPLLLGPLAIRKRFKQERLLHETVNASWDDEAYAVTLRSAQSRIAWKDYVFLRENDKIFIFATSSFNYQILPKRALTAAQIDDLHGIVGRHI